MSRANRAMGAIVLAAALVSAACGSRVADQIPNDQGGGVVAAGDGLGVIGEEATATTAPFDPSAGSVSPGDPAATARGASGPGRVGSATPAAPGAGGGDGPGDAPVTGPSAAGGPLTASSPGVTASEIKIGLVYDRSAGSANAAFGFAGIGQIDQKRGYDAIIAYINKNGGIGGRRLTPVYHELDSAGPDATTPPEVIQQRICTTFTENRVFGALVVGTETLTRCLNEARIVRVSGGAVDEQLLAESPLLVVLSVELGRVARFSVDRFHARGFYGEGKDATVPHKIGLVRYDDAQFARAGATLKKQLESKGLTLADEAAIRMADTTDQIADETNAARSAALRFKSNGITHVQFLGTNSARLQLLFMQAAEKQLYRPRYGLVSNDGGQALATLLGADAQNQLSKSLQVGWFPIFDVHRSEYSGDKTSPAFQRCIKILEEAGEGFTEGDPTRNKEALAALYCDNLFYFTAAAKAAGPNLTPDTFMAGVRSIDSLESAQTFILSTAERRDAFGGVKDGGWVDDCGCFRYADPTVHRV